MPVTQGTERLHFCAHRGEKGEAQVSDTSDLFYVPLAAYSLITVLGLHLIRGNLG